MGKKLFQRGLNLLGARLGVKNSSNSSLEELSGKVIDETRNLFVIRDESGRTVKIAKSVCVFEVELGGKSFFVDGNVLVGRLDKRMVGK